MVHDNARSWLAQVQAGDCQLVVSGKLAKQAQLAAAPLVGHKCTQLVAVTEFRSIMIFAL